MSSNNIKCNTTLNAKNTVVDERIFPSSRTMKTKFRQLVDVVNKRENFPNIRSALLKDTPSYDPFKFALVSVKKWPYKNEVIALYNKKKSKNYQIKNVTFQIHSKRSS
jgi:hypothetical protein